MRVFASCSSYTLGQMTSPVDACALISGAVGDMSREQLLPAVHALRELRRLDVEVELRVDGGSTYLAKSRSRHLAAALESTCDVWLTIDDDLDTTRETLALLLAAVDTADEPRISFAPYLLRHGSDVAFGGGSDVACVEWTPITVERQVTNGLGGPFGHVRPGHVRRAVRGGFGLVAMNRKALELVQLTVPSFRDNDGKMKPAAFLEQLNAAGEWLGDDLAFYSRMRGSGVVVEGLLTGETTHAGQRLDLSTLR